MNLCCLLKKQDIVVIVEAKNIFLFQMNDLN